MRRTATAVALGLAWLTCLGVAARGVSGAIPGSIAADDVVVSPQSPTPITAAPGTPTEFLDTYCTTCHNDQLLTGQLSLQTFDVANAAQQAQTAERMITKLRANMMPPPGMPRPGGDTLNMLVQRLEEHVDGAAENARRAGTRRFQRLNQDEYRRSIRTLLALEVDASNWLPSDNYVSSYDTYGRFQYTYLTLPLS